MADDLDFFMACWEAANPELKPPLPPLPDPSEEELEEMLDTLANPLSPPSDLAPLQAQGSISDLLSLAAPLEQAAQKYGIPTVFDDGGFKTLILCKLFGLTPLPGKGGDDAVDAEGRSFELKTLNLLDSSGNDRRTPPGVGAGTPLEQARIDRYRRTNSWLIGVFRGYHPIEVWQLSSTLLEPFYVKWEEQLRQAPGGVINNPKIPFQFVTTMGHRHYSARV